MRVRVATLPKVRVAPYRWLRPVRLCKLTFPCHPEWGDNWNVGGNSTCEANGVASVAGLVTRLNPHKPITGERGTVVIWCEG